MSLFVFLFTLAFSITMAYLGGVYVWGLEVQNWAAMIMIQGVTAAVMTFSEMIKK